MNAQRELHLKEPKDFIKIFTVEGEEHLTER